MPEHLYLISISMPFLTILLVFGMRYFALIRQARARLANDGAYQQIAERAVNAESGNATTLSSIEVSLADVRTRLTAIEKILKEVE